MNEIPPPDKFAPLTPEEVVDAPALPVVEDLGELGQPVPADAPKPPSTHFKFGEPSRRHIYRDADGAPQRVMHVLNGAVPITGEETIFPELTDEDFNSEIARLSKLNAKNYERERVEAAKKLGVRASVLDKLVKDSRPDEKTGQGRGVKLAEPEPWASPVDGVKLVSELTFAISKYVVLSKNDALAAALWAIHAFCFDLFTCTPRLAITAPEKRCGKTTLLDVLAEVVPRSLPTAGISAAATFRTIEAFRPTLMIDEADTFLGEDDYLRGVLNSGHRAGGQIIRTVGDDFEIRAFSTHCPVAIAQIGKLPDTLADRSISISMKRRVPGEKVARFRQGRTPELVEAARKAARWVADNAAAIQQCDPDIPEAIFNRAADNWAPLLAIAEVAGVVVAARAKEAALAACGITEDQNLKTMLLADIRTVFEDKACDCITSSDLVAALVALLDRPWGEINHGKALTQNGLARQLKGFGIKSGMVGPEHKRVSGYALKSFADSFNRYIPPFPTSHPHSTNKLNNLGENTTSQEKKGCEVGKPSNPLILNELCGCEVGNPQIDDTRDCADDLGPDGDTWEDRF